MTTPPTTAANTKTSPPEPARAAAQTRQEAKRPPRNPAPVPQLPTNASDLCPNSPKPSDRRRIGNKILPTLPRRPETRTARRPAHAKPQHLRREGGRQTCAALVDGRGRPADAEADAEDAAAAAVSIARGNPRPPRALPPTHDELGAEPLRLKKK